MMYVYRRGTDPQKYVLLTICVAVVPAHVHNYGTGQKRAIHKKYGCPQVPFVSQPGRWYRLCIVTLLQVPSPLGWVTLLRPLRLLIPREYGNATHPTSVCVFTPQNLNKRYSTRCGTPCTVPQKENTNNNKTVTHGFDLEA